jgi:hypothetical protein
LGALQIITTNEAAGKFCNAARPVRVADDMRDGTADCLFCRKTHAYGFPYGITGIGSVWRCHAALRRQSAKKDSIDKTLGGGRFSGYFDAVSLNYDPIFSDGFQ